MVCGLLPMVYVLQYVIYLLHYVVYLLQVKNSCDCDLRKFPYRKFPHFVKNLVAAWQPLTIQVLTLNGPIATKVVCFSRLLTCLRSLYGKQY